MDFDFYSLRIFCKIVEQGSFSQAAKLLGLTQPSVSQQVAKMEQQLGTKLFERVKHEIHLTESGKSFHRFALEMLEKGDEFREKMHQNTISPSGIVRYAMPESCQWTPHYRRIMSQISLFPDLKFEIGILPNDLITQGLIEGKLDFGFVVGERINPELRFEKFGDEAYSAVASKKEFFSPLATGETEKLRLVTYPGWELFFTTWAKSHGLWKKLKHRLNEPTVKIGTMSGAIHATQEGAGVAIIPTHSVIQELETKSLYEWKASKSITASNPIYLSKRIGEKPPKRVELVIGMLKEAKAALG